MPHKIQSLSLSPLEVVLTTTKANVFHQHTPATTVDYREVSRHCQFLFADALGAAHNLTGLRQSKKIKDTSCTVCIALLCCAVVYTRNPALMSSRDGHQTGKAARHFDSSPSPLDTLSYFGLSCHLSGDLTRQKNNKIKLWKKKPLTVCHCTTRRDNEEIYLFLSLWGSRKTAEMKSLKYIKSSNAMSASLHCHS